MFEMPLLKNYESYALINLGNYFMSLSTTGKNKIRTVKIILQ